MRSKILTTTALTALTTTSLLLNARADITTGLVGYWNLSDGPGSSTVADASGNGNTGTLVNFTDNTFMNMWTTPADPVSGVGYAMLFNQTGEGSDNYVSIPNSSSLNFTAANKAWTISAWVNCSVAGASEPANAGIVSKGDFNSANTSADAYGLYMSGGNFVTVFHNSAGTGTETVASTTTPVAGVWYHVVATAQLPIGSATAEAIIYVNGVRVSPANNNTYTTMAGDTLPVTIGCQANASGTINLPFQGTIDEVRLYNRALTASDVTQLYAYSTAPANDSGVGYWNGLAGSGGNATLDTTSLNFNDNVYTSPLVTASLSTILASQNACFFSDVYYNNGLSYPVASTNLTIVAGGVAIGNANGAGTIDFQNTVDTYILKSPRQG